MGVSGRFKMLPGLGKLGEALATSAAGNDLAMKLLLMAIVLLLGGNLLRFEHHSQMMARGMEPMTRLGAELMRPDPENFNQPMLYTYLRLPEKLEQRLNTMSTDIDAVKSTAARTEVKVDGLDQKLDKLLNAAKGKKP